MFSGIVQEIGSIAGIDSKQMVISCGILRPQVAEGSSVLVSGVCLTVSRVREKELAFDIMPETLRKTTLSELKPGDTVNLESSLRVGDELGGHFVYGHVDGVGDILSSEKERDAMRVTIRPPQELLRFLAPRGSVAIDGVSLTIARMDADSIMVSLVPYTLSHTTLGRLAVGDRVNIECDMLAKYAGNGHGA